MTRGCHGDAALLCYFVHDNQSSSHYILFLNSKCVCVCGCFLSGFLVWMFNRLSLGLEFWGHSVDHWVVIVLSVMWSGTDGIMCLAGTDDIMCSAGTDDIMCSVGPGDVMHTAHWSFCKLLWVGCLNKYKCTYCKSNWTALIVSFTVTQKKIKLQSVYEGF